MSSGSASGSTSRRIRVRAVVLVFLVAGLTLASYAALPAAFGNAPAVAPAHAPLAKEGPEPSKSAAVVAPHTVARAPSLPANWAQPHVAFHVPGPHPGSWGGATPPGAPMPVSGASGSGGVNWSQLEQRCYGVWPTRGGQAQYYEQCYGHDEPGLAPYSNLTGSGGNVSWQVQLPVDRGPTQNQSDLYSAIWFGMTLNDPYAWMNQCFLELQFYPDSSWTAPSGTVDGLWVGAAVAWQIEATSGAENPCYYGVLTQQGSPGSFFTMTQGDAINVTMTGWSGDSLGENLTITDVTSGQVSSLNLYNGTGNYPLDPAYTTDSWSNSLWWTPGGETPVSFAFETGHAGNPSFPSNNTFGGCSPGAPPSTGANPAVPCPSYDPSEWANDTFSPWEIAPPVFFNSASRVQAAQVGFTQDLGGLAFIDGSDIFGSFPYTCLGHETSGFCSYPWYSYSCAEGAYNFGATDYGTSPTSVDFGKATEYGTRVTVNAAGLGYYPPGNHSVPTCGGTSSALTVINPVGGGSITFLNATIPNGTTTTFTNLTGGDYSLAAWAAPGYSFDGWRTGFGATVQDPADAYTDVRFTVGVNAVTLTWATGPVALGIQTNVTFGSATTGATFTVVPGYASETFGDGPVAGTMEVTAGTTVALAPGLYSIQAQPPPSYNFTGWTSSNQSAAWFSAPAFPVTILDVPVSSGQVDVNATFVASLSIATVIVFTANAADTVVLNGSNYSGFAVAVLPVGSYPISYVGGPGAQFLTWLGGGSEIMTNFSSSSRVTFEAGTSTIEASDYAIQLVTLNDSGGNGTIAWSPDTDWGSVAIPSGTTIPVNISEATYPRFTLVATPGPGEAFAGWTINNTALGFFANRMSYDTTVTFNSTGVSPVGITAHYVTGGRANLYVHLSPSAGAGVLRIGFAAVPVSTGSVPSATGNVYVVVGANSGFVVTGLTANNGSTVRLVQAASAVTRPWAPWVWVVDVAGNTSLNATFRTLTYPVTFVADWAGGSPTATINGSTVGQGDTVWLPNGTYSLSATLGSGVTFLSWSPSWSDLNVSAPASLTTTFNVTGPGTLYALGSIPNGPIVVLSVLSPTSVSLRPGGSADVNATAYCLRGSCPSANLTFAWTLTNSAAGSLNVTTGAQVRFTAANVDANSELIVNATLNGTTVESAPASIAVVPALTGVTLTSSSGSIYAGQSVGIVPTLSCTANVTCPLGATITPSLGSPSLGFLGSNLTYPVTFTSYPGEVGTENISVQVSLNGVTLTPVVAVEVALPLLVGVTVAPTPISTPVGGSALVSATAGCSAGLGCPAGVQFTWTLAPTTLGALSSSTGSTVQFTAATTAGTGTLTAAGTLNGVTISSAPVPVTVTPSTVVVTLVSVTISPATLSIAVGSSGQFTAAVACSPDPCPSGVSVAWTLTGNVGTLSNPDGSSTNLSAAFAGSGSLYANGTLNGKTISAIPASVTVPSSGGSSSNSTPVYDSPLLWVAGVVIAVVLIAAYLLMRRGPSEGTPTPPAGANPPDAPK